MARVGRGLRELSKISGYSKSILLTWGPGQQYPTIMYPEGEKAGYIPAVHLSKIDPERWSRLRVIQVLTSDEFEDDDKVRTGSRLTEHQDGVLTPIPEGSHESMNTSSIPSLPDDLEELAAYLVNDKEELQDCLKEIRELCQVPLVEVPEEPPMSDIATIEERLPLHYLYSDDVLKDQCQIPLDNTSTHSECELDLSLFAGKILNLEEDLTKPDPSLPNGHDIMVFKVDNSRIKAQIVQRDDDNLTPEDIKTHWKDVCIAMQTELNTWVKLRCISRKLRKNARNIIDTRWVLRWKWEIPTSDATTQSGNKQAVKTIRARLTIRGFKDVDKNDIDRYAGTSSKMSQKLIVSEAAARDGTCAQRMSLKPSSKG